MRKSQQLSFIDLTVKYFTPDYDPLKIIFDSIDFSFIFHLVKDKYKPGGTHGYTPVSLFKAFLLIYLGVARSGKDLTNRLRFNARLTFL